MTAGKFVLWLAWGFSLCFQLLTTFWESTGLTYLVLTVFTLAILGLIHRLDELERQIAGHVPESEPKPELEPEESS